MGKAGRRISQQQLSHGQAFLEIGDRLFAIRHRCNQLALVPADVWDLLLGQLAASSLGSNDEVEKFAEAAVVIEVTTNGRVGLGPASSLLHDAGIGDEVEIVGAGPYLVLRPLKGVASAASPVEELWDRAWETFWRTRPLGIRGHD